MEYEQGYVGLIRCQRKAPNEIARILWVIALGIAFESDAETYGSLIIKGEIDFLSALQANYINEWTSDSGCYAM